MICFTLVFRINYDNIMLQVVHVYRGCKLIILILFLIVHTAKFSQNNIYLSTTIKIF